MDNPTLYFPGLRPDSYFTIGNIIYSNTLFGIQKFKITECRDLIFHATDQQDFDRRTFTYTSNQIFSYEELICIKKLIAQVQEESRTEKCTPEHVYELMSKKAKEGFSRFVVLFHRLDLMFNKSRNKVRAIVSFIDKIKDFEL